jgi:hypothetical protein
VPVKLRHPKARQHRITPEAVAAFNVALEGRERYHRCVRGECAAPEKEPGVRCEPCRQHLEASQFLRLALGLAPWQPSPLDTDTEEPPDWAGRGDSWREAWPLVRGLRLELEQETG